MSQKSGELYMFFGLQVVTAISVKGKKYSVYDNDDPLTDKQACRVTFVLPENRKFTKWWQGVLSIECALIMEDA